MNYDSYYRMFKTLFDSYGGKIREVERNDKLSLLGKQSERDRLEQERNGKIQGLERDVEAEYAKTRNGLSSKKEKVNVIERARSRMSQTATRELNLSDGDIWSDDVRFSIVDSNISGLRNEVKELKGLLKAQSLSHRSSDWFRSEIQRAMSEDDMERLSELQEAISLMHDGNSSRELEGVVSPLIDRMRSDRMSPQEKDAQAKLQELDKQHTLWKASVDGVLKLNRNEFRDYRGVSEVPQTEIVPYRPPTQQSSGQGSG